MTGPGWVSEPLKASPRLADLRRFRPDRYPHLLESTAADRGRYDILFAWPEESLTLTGDGCLHATAGDVGEGDFLTELDHAFRGLELPPAALPGSPPFRGGWFLYLAYEFGEWTHSRFRRPPFPAHEPLAIAERFRSALVFDHQTMETCFVAEADCKSRLADVEEDLRRAAVRPARAHLVCAAQPEEEDPAVFLEAVARTKAYIEAGDIFQANLSRRWRASIAQSPDDVYAALRRANPAPFAAIARIGAQTIISSSPERLVARQGSRLSVRPIAGTAPRVAGGRVDDAARDALRQHPKERAEHIMLVDLARNDLGRICETGSVHVRELLAIESYRYVHHLVSEVEGLCPDWLGPGAVLAAVFPGGTITGCPKIRAMEIIRELERGPRGAYTGGLGYLNRDGDLDFNILIRTLVQSEGILEFRTGAGIVADSSPRRELRETQAKAEGLLTAIGKGHALLG